MNKIKFLLIMFLGILSQCNIIYAENTLNNVNDYIKKGFILSEKYENISNCNTTKEQYNTTYNNYTRSNCFFNNDGYYYFICSKDEACNIDNNVGSSDKTKTNISDKQKIALDSFFKKIEQIKATKSSSEYQKMIEKLKSSTTKLKIKYKNKPQLYAMCEYILTEIERIENDEAENNFFNELLETSSDNKNVGNSSTASNSTNTGIASNTGISPMTRYPGCNSDDIVVKNGTVFASCNAGHIDPFSNKYTKTSICASGYHIPTKAEFDNVGRLINFFPNQNIGTWINLAIYEGNNNICTNSVTTGANSISCSSKEEYTKLFGGQGKTNIQVWCARDQSATNSENTNSRANFTNITGSYWINNVKGGIFYGNGLDKLTEIKSVSELDSYTKKTLIEYITKYPNTTVFGKKGSDLSQELGLPDLSKIQTVNLKKVEKSVISNSDFTKYVYMSLISQSKGMRLSFEEYLALTKCKYCKNNIKIYSKYTNPDVTQIDGTRNPTTALIGSLDSRSFPYSNVPFIGENPNNFYSTGGFYDFRKEFLENFNRSVKDNYKSYNHSLRILPEGEMLYKLNYYSNLAKQIIEADSIYQKNESELKSILEKLNSRNNAVGSTFDLTTIKNEWEMYRLNYIFNDIKSGRIYKQDEIQEIIDVMLFNKGIEKELITKFEKKEESPLNDFKILNKSDGNELIAKFKNKELMSLNEPLPNEDLFIFLQNISDPNDIRPIKEKIKAYLPKSVKFNQ